MADVLKFRAALAADEDIYRVVAVRPAATLTQLAQAIMASFKFNFDHAFGFYDNLDDHYESKERFELFADMGNADPGVQGVEKTKVGVAFPEPGKQMLFLFDYGDDWMFVVEFLGPKPAEKGRYPRLLESVGEAPVQYPDEPMDEGEEPDERFGVNPATGERFTIKRK
jgi:hypothetical protein